MQNRYVGDVGDYVKLAILRLLSPGRMLGVAWWLFPDENHNEDGRHLAYLDQPARWRQHDPYLFDFLLAIRARGVRNVQELEAPELFPSGAVFMSEPIPCPSQISRRKTERELWFSHVKSRLEETQLIFVDPDNGIAPIGYRPTTRVAGKSIALEEIVRLTELGKPVVVYHHHTRMKGGHLVEIDWLAARMINAGVPVIGALRASPWSPRLFFLLGDDATLEMRATEIADKWRPYITWHPANNRAA